MKNNLLDLNNMDNKKIDNLTYLFLSELKKDIDSIFRNEIYINLDSTGNLNVYNEKDYKESSNGHNKINKTHLNVFTYEDSLISLKKGVEEDERFYEVFLDFNITLQKNTDKEQIVPNFFYVSYNYNNDIKLILDKDLTNILKNYIEEKNKNITSKLCLYTNSFLTELEKEIKKNNFNKTYKNVTIIELLNDKDLKEYIDLIELKNDDQLLKIKYNKTIGELNATRSKQRIII